MSAAEDVIDDDCGRALLYLGALGRSGYRPTWEELSAYVERGQRRRYGLGAGFAAALEAVSERPVSYMRGVKWIEPGNDGRVYLTAAGRALERALRAAPADANDQAWEIALDPDDPLVLGRLVHALADGGAGMLVDPYVRLDQLRLVVEYTSLRRVLTTRKIGSSDVQALRAMLDSGKLTRPIEVRLTSTLHDRHLMRDDGRVLFLGASVSTVGKTMTVIGELRDAASELAKHYEDLWAEATPVTQL